MIREDINRKNRIKHSLLAGLVTAFAFVLICAYSRIAPFGDNTFLMFDLKRQYVDYYSYFKSLITGENDIFYSFSTALGSGMIGFEIYYVSSPLLLLLFLFPQSYMPVGITMIIGIKLTIATIIMDLFLQYYLADRIRRNSMTDGIKVAFGAVSWGLSGYLFSQSMNLMWIDVIMIVPVVIWALDRVILANRKLTYCLLISLILFLNYYISYQVMLFIAFWTIYRIWVLKIQEPHKAVWRVVYCSFLGGLCDMGFLYPTLLELMDSPKDITQLGLKTKGVELSLFDILSKAPALAYDYIEARSGWPQIYCGVIFVALLLLFYINKRIELRERIGIFALMSILMLSFMSDKINLLWHAGMEPSGYPYRQAYLWVFLVIICGIKTLLDADIFKNLKLPVSLVAVAVVFALSMRTEYEHNTRFSMMVNYGIITVYIVVCLLAFLLIKRYQGSKAEKVQFLALTIIVITQFVELFANSSHTYMMLGMNGSKFSEYKSTVANTEQTVQWIKEYDNSFYRMENLNPRQQNDSMQYTYNGITHYSSAGKTYVRYLLQAMGYNDDGLHANYGHDNTVNADMLLGVKYILSDGTYPQHKSYSLIKEGAVSAYNNPFAISLAVATKDFDLSGIECEQSIISSDNWKQFIPEQNPFALQEEMVNRLAGEKFDIFKTADVKVIDSIEKKDGKEYPRRSFEVTASIEGEMYMYLDGLLGTIQGLTIYKNGEMLTTYGNASCIKILNLGFVKAGDTVSIYIDDGAEDANFGEAYFVTEDIDELERAHGILSGNNATVAKEKSSHLIIETGDCNGVFISLPCEEGWTAKVDGTEVVPVAVFGALTYIPITNDRTSHTVEMNFVPRGMIVGGIGSLLGIAALILVLYMEKKTYKK